jgi:hypothetical protein
MNDAGIAHRCHSRLNHSPFIQLLLTTVANTTCNCYFKNFICHNFAYLFYDFDVLIVHFIHFDISEEFTGTGRDGRAPLNRASCRPTEEWTEQVNGKRCWRAFCALRAGPLRTTWQPWRNQRRNWRLQNLRRNLHR